MVRRAAAARRLWGASRVRASPTRGGGTGSTTSLATASVPLCHCRDRYQPARGQPPAPAGSGCRAPARWRVQRAAGPRAGRRGWFLAASWVDTDFAPRGLPRVRLWGRRGRSQEAAGRLKPKRQCRSADQRSPFGAAGTGGGGPISRRPRQRPPVDKAARAADGGLGFEAHRAPASGSPSGVDHPGAAGGSSRHTTPARRGRGRPSIQPNPGQPGRLRRRLARIRNGPSGSVGQRFECLRKRPAPPGRKLPGRA